MNRRSYSVSIMVNGKQIRTVFIDPHYETKHWATINDVLILQLIHTLHEGDFIAETMSGSFEYYATDHLLANNKKYRLVWLIENEKLFIGVINAYRRST